MSADEKDLVNALAAHWEIAGNSSAFACTCGYGLGDGTGDVEARHRAHVAEELTEELAKPLRSVAAALYRDHDMPPRKDSRSYTYRMGWWDGVHHAAKVVERAASSVHTPIPTPPGSDS